MMYLSFGSRSVFTIVRLRPVQAGFCAHTPGDYWIFDYWIFQHDPPPRVTAAAAARPRRSFLQGPGPAHHSHPGTKYPVRGPLTPILFLDVGAGLGLDPPGDFVSPSPSSSPSSGGVWSLEAHWSGLKPILLG